MKRYFAPTKKGQLKCSEEALKMFNDPKGRSLLRIYHESPATCLMTMHPTEASN